MSVIAELTVPADQFALGDLLEGGRGPGIRLDSMAGRDGMEVPYLWVASQDAAIVEETLAQSPAVEEVRVLDEVGDETLFRVTWAGAVDGVVDAIHRTEAVVLDGEGRGEDWLFRLRFPHYGDLSAFYRTLADRGVTVGLEGVHDRLDSSPTREIDLTPEQREALLLALEEGYFDVPRETTLVELAAMLDISDSAVSQRIRRGTAAVLARTVVRDASDR